MCAPTTAPKPEKRGDPTVELRQYLNNAEYDMTQPMDDQLMTSADHINWDHELCELESISASQNLEKPQQRSVGHNRHGAAMDTTQQRRSSMPTISSLADRQNMLGGIDQTIGIFSTEQLMSTRVPSSTNNMGGTRPLRTHIPTRSRSSSNVGAGLDIHALAEGRRHEAFGAKMGKMSWSGSTVYLKNAELGSMESSDNANTLFNTLLEDFHTFEKSVTYGNVSMHDVTPTRGSNVPRRTVSETSLQHTVSSPMPVFKSHTFPTAANGSQRKINMKSFDKAFNKTFDKTFEKTFDKTCNKPTFDKRPSDVRVKAEFPATTSSTDKIIKQFSCRHQGCNAVFTTQLAAVGHMRKIHGTVPGKTKKAEKLFVCVHENCQKRFTRNDELTRHLRSHTGLKPFTCGVCELNFTRADHLKAHTKKSKRHMRRVAELAIENGEHRVAMGRRDISSTQMSLHMKSSPMGIVAKGARQIPRQIPTIG